MRFRLHNWLKFFRVVNLPTVPGDVLVGAAKDSWFSHLAIEVSGEKASTEWCEPVSDEDYGKLK